MQEYTITVHLNDGSSLIENQPITTNELELLGEYLGNDNDKAFSVVSGETIFIFQKKKVSYIEANPVSNGTKSGE